MIRVFARKTKMSPSDNLAFFGLPPLGKLPDVPVYISCLFTWDVPQAHQLYGAWSFAWRRKRSMVRIGGPAFGSMATDAFVPGRFVKPGVTMTSRGCPKRCPWCFVPSREGPLRTMPHIAPGNNLIDNNLLACRRGHLEKVFAMLAGQRAVKFSGGLDIDYLTPWVVEQLKALPSLQYLYVACDSERDLRRLDKAADLLGDISIEKKRCYVLVGFDGETQARAAQRCRAVLAKGFLPYAQLFRGAASSKSRGLWRDFCGYWSQPRLYRKKELMLLDEQRGSRDYDTS